MNQALHQVLGREDVRKQIAAQANRCEGAQ